MDQKRPIVIGAGPGGATAAIYLARYNHPVILIDAPANVPGRTIMAPDIQNFPGMTDPLSGPSFIERLDQQLRVYPQIERVEEEVISVSKQGDTFVVLTDAGRAYDTDAVIVAVGLRDIMPPIDGLGLYYDHSLFHCLTCDWYERRDKKLVFVAKDDRGILASVMIKSLHEPPSLAVVPGSDSFSFSDSALDQAGTAGIPVYLSPIRELTGEDGFLKSIRLADGAAVEAEVLFTKLGHERLDGFLDKGMLTVERNPDGFIKVDFRTFETSVPNLFAVGPCNEGPDQIVISAGQGAVAALEVHKRIVERTSAGSWEAQAK